MKICTLPCNKSAFAFLSFSASDGVGVKIGETGDGAMASSSEPSESESKEIAEFFDSGRDISQFWSLLTKLKNSDYKLCLSTTRQSNKREVL